MRTALVLGVNGQDGSYIAESLLLRGYKVYGIGRNPASKYIPEQPSFCYFPINIRHIDEVDAFLSEVKPDLIFHFAAIHGAAGFQYEPVWASMWDVNVASLQCLLEHARRRAPNSRIIYASSSKIFRQPHAGLIDEDSATVPSCLYGISKIAARDTIFYYREKHGIRATNLVLFNHDSPRRRSEYFLPTIARAIAAAKADKSSRTTVKTLNFNMDWGAAQEYADIAVDVAENTNDAQLVIASGVTWHARKAIQRLFELNGLDYKSHIEETCVTDANLSSDFQVKIDRLEKAIGRRPQRGVEDIVQEMLRKNSR